MRLFNILSLIIISIALLLTGCDSDSGGTEDTGAPDTPANITVTPDKGGTCTLTWTGNANNGSYTLVHHTDPDTGIGLPVTVADAVSGLEITGLTIAQAYYFWVIPVDKDDTEMTPVAAPNNTAGGYTMPDYDDPDTPSVITVTPGKGGTVTIAWAGGVNDGSYNLIYNTQNSTTVGSPHNETGVSSGIEFTGLTIGGTYYFWIVPVDKEGSELSPVAAPNNTSSGYTTPDYDDPDTPAQIQLNIYSSGEVFVKWTGNLNDGSYKVYADTDLDISNGTAVTVTDPEYDESENKYYQTLNSLTEGNDYYICVVPVKQDGTELTPVWYDADTNTPGDDPIHISNPAQIPSNVTAEIDKNGNVLVTWDGSANDGIYYIRCGNTSDSWSKQYKNVTSPYTISDLGTGTWYVKVHPGTDGTISDGIAANSGIPVQVWVPNLINEVSLGTGVRHLHSDGDYIYYTCYNGDFGIIDIREVTDFSDAGFNPTPVTQNVTNYKVNEIDVSLTINGIALAGDEAYFALSTTADKDCPEMARVLITKSSHAPSLTSPVPYNKTGPAKGFTGNNVATDGTYVYLLALNKDSPQRLYLHIFDPRYYTWGAESLIDPSDNGCALTFDNNKLYADTGNKITTFDVSTPGTIGAPVDIISSNYSNQIITVSENLVFVSETTATDITLYSKADYSQISSVSYSSSINSMFISGNFLFATNSNSGTKGMGIIDITDPANPGSVRWVITGTDTTNNYDKKAAGIAVVGNNAFVGTPTGISVIQLAE